MRPGDGGALRGLGDAGRELRSGAMADTHERISPDLSVLRGRGRRQAVVDAGLQSDRA